RRAANAVEVVGLSTGSPQRVRRTRASALTATTLCSRSGPAAASDGARVTCPNTAHAPSPASSTHTIQGVDTTVRISGGLPNLSGYVRNHDVRHDLAPTTMVLEILIQTEQVRTRPSLPTPHARPRT